MANQDVFRPRNQPAQAIYDAFQAEAAKRLGRPFEVWKAAELQAVWAAARDAAQQAGLPVLTLADVEQAEISACGHVDYGAQWAYAVVAMMRQRAKQPSMPA